MVYVLLTTSSGVQDQSYTSIARALHVDLGQYLDGWTPNRTENVWPTYTSSDQSEFQLAIDKAYNGVILVSAQLKRHCFPSYLKAETDSVDPDKHNQGEAQNGDQVPRSLMVDSARYCRIFEVHKKFHCEYKSWLRLIIIIILH